tara:strand:- start:349 stop:519 length:171 start_codon:yes stop_codon:yes gene_type:complete
MAINILIKEIITSYPKPSLQKHDVVEFKRLKEADNEIPKELSINQIFDRIRMLGFY